MSSWPGPIAAVTLFVEDLQATKEFYVEIFALPVHYEDADSAVFKFGDTLVNLLRLSEADDLIAPGMGSAYRQLPGHSRTHLGARLLVAVGGIGQRHGV